MYVHARKSTPLPENAGEVQRQFPHLSISIAMEESISETYRRRALQETYNQTHGITPTTIISSIKDIGIPRKKTEIFDGGNTSKEKISVYIKRLELEMDVAAANLDFEHAAELRDELLAVRKQGKV